MTEWISVNDHLPEIPTNHKSVKVIVAVYDGSGNNDYDFGSTVTEMIYQEDSGFMEHLFGEWNPVKAFDKVTHWMYFPEAPQRKKT